MQVAAAAAAVVGGGSGTSSNSRSLELHWMSTRAGPRPAGGNRMITFDTDTDKNTDTDTLI